MCVWCIVYYTLKICVYDNRFLIYCGLNGFRCRVSLAMMLRYALFHVLFINTVLNWNELSWAELSCENWRCCYCHCHCCCSLSKRASPVCARKHTNTRTVCLPFLWCGSYCTCYATAFKWLSICAELIWMFSNYCLLT